MRKITILVASAVLGAVLAGGCSDDDKGGGGSGGGAGAGGAGGGGGAAGTGGGAGGMAGGGGGAAASCATYCTMVLAACTGSNQLYASMDACMTTCAAIPTTGGAGDMSGDSLHCRITHAGLAAAAPLAHCGHASDAGNGECGEPCAVYCDRIGKRCPMVAPAGDGCMAACGMYTNDTSAWGSTGGNTLQCRLYHVGSPAATMPMVHCPHTGTSGGGVCS